jgi:hypothetical protein
MGEDGERSKVECPICGEYVGEPESVRNHITASLDADHAGEDGAQYLGQLVEQANGGDLPDDPFAEDKPATKPEQGSEPAKPDTGLEQGEIKEAKKVETDEGGEAFSFVIYGGLGLLLWLMAKNDTAGGDTYQQAKPPGVN